MILRFVVDESEFNLSNVSPANRDSVIERFLDLIENAQDTGNDVCYDDELFQRTVLGAWTFWDLFDTTSQAQLSRETMERAASIFSSLPRWYEVDDLTPESFDVCIDGGPTQTIASVAWAHGRTIGGGLSSPACLRLDVPGAASGELSVEVAGVSEGMWFAKDSEELKLYWRWLLAAHASHQDHIAAFAAHAFPQLDFVDRCFDGITKMSRSCRNIAPDIVRHLGALSDHGPRIFSGPWSSVPQEFGQFRVDISDENGGTKQNGTARQEREYDLSGTKIYFWWHTKIDRDQDRIHIYPNTVATTGKILVGIFCRHLTV